MFNSFFQYRKFFSLLYSYSKENYKLVSFYVFALIADTFAKLFAVVSIVPLLNFLSEGSVDSSAVSTNITFIFKDLLEAVNINYSLESSGLVFITATFIVAITEILFYSIGRKNSYQMGYYSTSLAVKNFYRQGLKSINSQSFGIIQNTFQKEIEKITNGIDGILRMFASIIQVTFLLLLAFSLSASMSALTLILMTIIFFILSSLNPLITKLGFKVTESGNQLSHALFEPLLNAKQVLSFGRIEWASNKHTIKYKEHARDAILSQTVVFSIPVIFRTLGIIAALVALYFSITSGENAAVLIATLVALIRITPVASEITSSLNQLSLAVPSLAQFERLFGVFNKSQKESTLKKYSGFRNSIKLSKIDYSHDSIRNSISDIDLIIKKNSYVAFVGPSGSGKTTCVDIILGLLKPTNGLVMIDNDSMNDIDSETFLNRIGYVQQSPFLFNGSIKDNLLWSNPDATESGMWDALHIANIDKFIRSTEHQLDTQVGDRGVALSGGQKQRIVLAQALIRKPDILILDEATNSLDPESEYFIMESLEKISHNTTIISITHKPSFAKIADIIFVFNDGIIVESGSYDELIKNNNSFLNKTEYLSV